jgi:hypothetical protein
MKESLIYLILICFLSPKTFAQEPPETNDSLPIDCSNRTYNRDLIGYHDAYGEKIIIFKKFTRFTDIYAPCYIKFYLYEISNVIFVPVRPILLERDFNVDNIIKYNPLLSQYNIHVNNIKGVELFNTNAFPTYDSNRPQVFGYFDLTNLDMYLNDTRPITSCSYLTLANMTTSLTQFEFIYF